MTPDRAVLIVGTAGAIHIHSRADKHGGAWIVEAEVDDERREVYRSVSVSQCCRWRAVYERLCAQSHTTN